ncbi:MAG TPA: hypothetical protein VFO49_02760 [Nocardioides sp.]|nr:hypothetical protein [Nocardioides sp.]
MSTHIDAAAGARMNTKQKVGLVLCGLYSLANIPSALAPTPEDETGPPLGILVIGSILGLIGLIATVLAWRGNSVALRVAAGSMIVVTLTGLPAFFVDVPTWVKALVGFAVLVTVVTVVLMFSGDRRSAPVTD